MSLEPLPTRTHVLSPKQLAWCLTQPNAALPYHAASALARTRQDAEAMRVSDLARRFTTLVRACGVDGDRPPDATAAFEAWLVDVRTCGITAQDGVAVRAALATPWSNIQAEGQISRLNMLKRHVRARRLRLAASMRHTRCVI